MKKVFRNATPENTVLVSKRAMNESLSLLLAEQGAIFVSNVERREAWRMENRFSKLLGIKVRGFNGEHQHQGSTYPGYWFKVIPNIPMGGYPARCYQCGAELPKVKASASSSKKAR